MGIYPCEYCICDVTAPAFSILPCVDDLYLQVWVFVQDLLDTTVVAAFLGLDSSPRWSIIVVFDVAQVLRM